MYQKALLFKDTATAAKILADPSPRTARTLGREVASFSDETWNANRERIVLDGSVAKFTCAVSEVGFRRGNGEETGELPAAAGKKTDGDASEGEVGGEGQVGGEGEVGGAAAGGRLAAALLETGDREIVEASPGDRIWGVGFGAKRAGGQRERWGLNLLGKALVEARRVIREREGERGGK